MYQRTRYDYPTRAGLGQSYPLRSGRRLRYRERLQRHENRLDRYRAYSYTALTALE